MLHISEEDLMPAFPLMAFTFIAALQFQGARTDEIRFRAMDRNNDGVISRDEWTGTAQSFRENDWNRDGILSGDEIRVNPRRTRRGGDARDFDRIGAGQASDWNEAGFSELDYDRDGRIVANEWLYDLDSFRDADRNRDGWLSRSEFLGRADVTIDSLDSNRNGRIERREWRGTAAAFNGLDRNRDGVLTRAEADGLSGTSDIAVPRVADQLSILDTNRDGRVSANEWRGTRRAFNQRDLNRDGVLTQRELSIGADPVVATSGQSSRVDPAQRWTDTGITVTAGATLIVNAEGTVQLSDDSNDVASPFGARRRASEAPLPQAPAGILIGRIDNSAPFVVGDRMTMRAPVNGRLYLGVNDDHLPDNRGEFLATITVQR
jgi:Ca2+-binding EF-hand superfamily protein